MLRYLKQVTDLLARVPRVKELGEEVSHDVRQEADLHDHFKGDQASVDGLTKAREIGGAER